MSEELFRSLTADLSKIFYIFTDNGGQIFTDRIREGTFRINSDGSFYYEDNNGLAYYITIASVQRVVLYNDHQENGVNVRHPY